MTVPFVGCPSDGQVGPLPPPQHPAKPLVLPANIARRLAYYQAEEGGGVLAPRGWHCFSTYGSNGSSLFVAPQPLTSAFFSREDHSFQGPVIQLSEMMGDTSGRFSVAETIGLVFPAYRKFAQLVVDEHLGLDKLSDGPYPTDRLHYLTDAIVEYTTPANTDGLGTKSWLRKNNSPITGVAMLTDADTDCITLFMRLPPELASLAPVITEHLINEPGYSPPPRP